jgi:CheY-like chemotaxis protein
MSSPPEQQLATIVVVEDDLLNMKLVTTVLGINGYRYYSAETAEQGIELIREHRPDMVLMDINLPGMDGLTATKNIKADTDICEIPVVILSAMGEDFSDAEEVGAMGLITKPITISSFVEDLAGFLTSSAPPRTRKSA